MDRRQAMKTLAMGAAALPLASLEGPFARAVAAPAAATGTTVAAGPFTLPALTYAYDALEPHIDAETMRIHHDKHHAAYVNNLNKAVAGRPEVDGWSLEKMLRDIPSLPDDLRTAVRNQGGGHANHSLFWTLLKRDGAKAPKGELAAAIDQAFGSFDAFRAQFDKAAGSVFGSGWAWLSAARDGSVKLHTSANQDSPISEGLTPLAGLDVWEHAYYLKYQNRRADYVAAFHQVLDWDAVAARYRDARKG